MTVAGHAAPSLLPLRPPAFALWFAALIVDYAADLHAAGLSAQAAENKARTELAKDFPGGVGTDAQLVFAVMVDGAQVGVIWIAPGPVDDSTNWWVYDLAIDPAFRRRGYGRAAMLLGEQEAAARGATRLSLNVFARNRSAAALYSSLGYQPTKIHLQKRL